jgi:myo-inositol-1(or 4)-monophosphatase
MHPLLNTAVTIARNAGKFIIRNAAKLGDSYIDKWSYAKNIESLAREQIIEEIRTVYPQHLIGAADNDYCKDATLAEIVWLIDSLDSKLNYCRGVPHVAVSIAIRYDGHIQHAVIFDPMKQELFTASRGKGAQLNNRRIRVTETKDKQIALFASEANVAPFSSLGVSRVTGSVVLNLAYVAAGRFDGVVELNQDLHVLAAGTLLVKEAGGLVGDIDGSENYFASGNIVAATPKMLKNILQLKF